MTPIVPKIQPYRAYSQNSSCRTSSSVRTANTGRLRIRGANRRADGRDQRGRVAADADRQAGIRELAVRKRDERERRDLRVAGIDSPQVHVRRDADDRDPLSRVLLGPDPEPPVDRTLVRPHASGHRLVDDGDRSGRIRFGEVAPLPHAHVERPQDLRGHGGKLRSSDAGSRRLGLRSRRRSCRRRPRSGTRFEANTACTPGRPSTRRTMSSTRRALTPDRRVAIAAHEESHRQERTRCRSPVGSRRGC